MVNPLPSFKASISRNFTLLYSSQNQVVITNDQYRPIVLLCNHTKYSIMQRRFVKHSYLSVQLYLHLF